MRRSLGWMSWMLAGLVYGGVSTAHAASHEDFEKLKAELDSLNKQVDARAPLTGKTTGSAEALVDKAVDKNISGPNVITTRQGKLTMGGLMQVWFYTIQNDNQSWVDVEGATNSRYFAGGSNEVADNDSFRIRRSEIKFQLDATENMTAYISMDPARMSAVNFPTFPSNLGNQPSGDGVAYYDAGVTGAGAPGGLGALFAPAAKTVGAGTGNLRNVPVQQGTASASRMLQDAYINVHGILPHHDSSVGQMKPRLGEEGYRDNAQLDFVERSMITQLAELRDMGGQIHGSWFDSRLQYWVGAFDGAGTAFQQHQNRADDNDNKDILVSILGRPVWKNDTWGSLELGASFKAGKGGEAGGHAPTTNPVDGLNQRSTNHHLGYAWVSYLPGGPVKGWWIRGEVGNYRDRFAPGAEGPTIVSNPAEFDVWGGYVATGYKLSDSIFKDKVWSMLKPVEFAFRAEQMQNLFFPDMVYPTRRTDIFKTTVYTAGLNYYIKGNNAKIQLNYNRVIEGDKDNRNNIAGYTNYSRSTRAVQNDNFVVNFQVAW